MYIPQDSKYFNVVCKEDNSPFKKGERYCATYLIPTSVEFYALEKTVAVKSMYRNYFTLISPIDNTLINRPSCVFDIIDSRIADIILNNIIEEIEYLKDVKRIICVKKSIDGHLNYDLTLNKVYDVFEYLPHVKPNGRFRLASNSIPYPKELFITVDEWRDKQINKILY